jgi:hypothetical protein
LFGPVFTDDGSDEIERQIVQNGWYERALAADARGLTGQSGGRRRSRLFRSLT